MGGVMSKYVVTCRDNIQRHEKWFDTYNAAEEFAETGHACVRPHIITILTDGGRWVRSRLVGNATVTLDTRLITDLDRRVDL